MAIRSLFLKGEGTCVCSLGDLEILFDGSQMPFLGIFPTLPNFANDQSTNLPSSLVCSLENSFFPSLPHSLFNSLPVTVEEILTTKSHTERWLPSCSLCSREEQVKWCEANHRPGRKRSRGCCCGMDMCTLGVATALAQRGLVRLSVQV